MIFEGRDIQSLPVCVVRSLLNKKLLPAVPWWSKTLQIAHSICGTYLHSLLTHVPRSSNSGKIWISLPSSQHTPGLLKEKREAEMAGRCSWPLEELYAVKTDMRSRIHLFLHKIRPFLIDFDARVKSASLCPSCRLSDLSLDIFYFLAITISNSESVP